MYSHYSTFTLYKEIYIGLSILKNHQIILLMLSPPSSYPTLTNILLLQVNSQWLINGYYLRDEEGVILWATSIRVGMFLSYVRRVYIIKCEFILTILAYPG